MTEVQPRREFSGPEFCLTELCADLETPGKNIEADSKATGNTFKPSTCYRELFTSGGSPLNLCDSAAVL